ncbi:MAG: hypothetical protein ABI639_04355 [Thermoanaerobaculia bacterium]
MGVAGGIASKIAGKPEGFRHVRAFLADEEVQALNELIARNDGLYTEVHGKGGLGPKYRVIDGDQILARLPAIAALGASRVRPLAEDFAGHPLQPLTSSKRAQRVQSYSRREHGFRWHFDGHAFVALVTLENGNEGQTHFISPRLSRWMRFLLYPLYPFPQLFSALPYEVVTARPGDLLVMRGARVLHRGVSRADAGRRVLLAFTFDPPGKKANPFRDAVARRLNY